MGCQKQHSPSSSSPAILKHPTKYIWRWEPDRRYNFFSPPAHLCPDIYDWNIVEYDVNNNKLKRSSTCQHLLKLLHAIWSIFWMSCSFRNSYALRTLIMSSRLSSTLGGTRKEFSGTGAVSRTAIMIRSSLGCLLKKFLKYYKNIYILKSSLFHRNGNRRYKFLV